ncbi:hypothetical protein OAE19_05220 [Porticoccaceae bacterium]|nr:hypothetical protein [Porticoccaceae bacterium]
MDITVLPVRDAIAAVYSGVASVIWDFSGAESKKDFARVKKYCPACKQGNTLREIEPTEDNGQCRFRCRSCDHFCKYPVALMSRGPQQRSSQVSRINPNNRVARAMESSKVMNAVESLPDELRLWTFWMYTDPDQAQRDKWEGRLLAMLIDHLDDAGKNDQQEGSDSGGIKGIRAGADAVRVINMQMNSFRHSRRCDKALYRAADYARAIGKDRKQFDRSRLWGRLCVAAVAKMEEMDCATMEPVEEVLHGMRE